MSESKMHLDLVGLIINRIQKMVDQDDYDCIYADYPGYKSPNLSFGKYVPDVMYKYRNKMIIGEAKTIDDFDREHSKLQFLSYINECLTYPGESVIIIAIPWEKYISAKNHFRKLKRDFSCDTKVIVLSQNGIEGIV